MDSSKECERKQEEMCSREEELKEDIHLQCIDKSVNSCI